jgi:hypothetical protein
LIVLTDDSRLSTAASSMLKKAKSFRTDIMKIKLPRGPGNNQNREKIGKSATLSRTGSFNGGSDSAGKKTVSCLLCFSIPLFC